MYEYLERHKKEQDRKNEFLPTVQLKLKRGNIASIVNACFINELIKDFYEKPELFKDTNFKARVKLVDIAEALKDEAYLLNEKHELSERVVYLKYYYEYFKKKKYIKIETPEGKIARKNKMIDAYAVLTPLGVEEFLNLDKEDLTSKLDPFLEKYLDEYSFVLEENRQYIKPDSKKVQLVLTDLFKKARPMLEEKYLTYYMCLKEKAEYFVSLEGKELDKFYKNIRGTELQYFIDNITRYDHETKSYSLDLTEKEILNYINDICDTRIKIDAQDFVNKLSLKIAGTIKNRDYNIEGNINTDLESLLKITLSDGAKFEVKTQIVEVVNQYGTFFFRKPTTFHNVYMASGESLKTPSYEKVVKYL